MAPSHPCPCEQTRKRRRPWKSGKARRPLRRGALSNHFTTSIISAMAQKNPPCPLFHLPKTPSLKNQSVSIQGRKATKRANIRQRNNALVRNPEKAQRHALNGLQRSSPSLSEDVSTAFRESLNHAYTMSERRNEAFVRFFCQVMGVWMRTSGKTSQYFSFQPVNMEKDGAISHCRQVASPRTDTRLAPSPQGEKHHLEPSSARRPTK